MPVAHVGWIRSFTCAVALLVPAAAQGQAPPEGNELRSSATLPVSNESILLSSRAIDAIESGDDRLAIQLIEQIYAQRDGLIPLPASATFYPAWRQGERLLRQLSPAGVRMVQQLYDAGVAATLEAARRTGDVQALREAFWRRPLSAHRTAVATELAAWYLELGQAANALEILRELRPGDPVWPAAVEALRVVALAESGAVGEAARAAERCLAGAADADRRLFERLQGWLAGRAATVATPADAFQPVLTAATDWVVPLQPINPSAARQDSAGLLDALDALRRVPVLEPAVADNVLAIRMHGTIWALDTLTLATLWRATEVGAGGIDTQALSQPGGEMGFEGRRLSPQTRLLLTHRLAHAVTIGGGAVYSVEAVGAGVSDAFGGPRIRTAALGAAHGVLVARDLRSGRLLWRSDDEPTGPLAQVSFQDRPILVDGRLLAPVERHGELILVVLAPDSGRLLQEVRVASPPTHFGSGGRCVLLADATTIYLSTGNGAIAAFERPSLDWKWATLYQSTVAERNSRFWWQPAADPLEWSPEMPLLVQDLLIVAPVDSSAAEVLALDRYDGTKRWSLPRRDLAFLVGAVGDGLIVGSHRLTCLDLHQPATAPRWRSVPLEIAGRPEILGTSVYVPTRDGVVVIDGRTGKLLQEQGRPPLAAGQPRPATPPGRGVSGEAEACRLVMGDAALYRVTPTRVAKYPDIERLRSLVTTLRQRDPADPRLDLLDARVAALAGEIDAGIQILEAAAGRGVELAPEQRQLLGELYLAQARAADSAERRLPYLRKAMSLGEGGGDSQAVALLLGDELLANGRPLEALEVYRAVLLDGGAGELERSSPSHRKATWLAAVTRMRECLHRLDSMQAGRAIDELITEAEASAHAVLALFRLRLAATGDGLRQRVNRALATQRMPPELALPIFAELDAEPQSEPPDNALLLARWETHVSLGLLDEAGRDRQRWEQRIASASVARPADERRAQLLINAERKLRDLAGSPFRAPFYRQWRMTGAELLFDARQPLAATGQWLPIRSLDDRALQLIDSVSNQQPWRDHVDALTTGWEALDAQAGARRDALAARRPGEGEISRPFWPVAIHQFLAAVPVEGGLIAIGLGPERYGGQRLWELPVPDWTEIPRRFAALAAATREGVVFCPRADRIALTGWLDGRTWWERDWPGAEIRGLDTSGDTLAIWTDDGAVWQCQLTDGENLRRVELESTNVSGLRYCDATLIIWGGDFICGVSRADGAVRWRRVVPGVGGLAFVAGRSWLLLRPLGQMDWELIESADGEPVFGTTLGDLGSVLCAGVDGDQLLIASRADEDAETGETRAVGLFSFGLADASRRWSQRVVTRVDVNLTQLLGTAEIIPLLRAERDAEAPAGQDPALALVRKADGALLGEVSLTDEFRAHSSASCDLHLLATPSRVLVQIAGNLLAYGNSDASAPAEGR